MSLARKLLRGANPTSGGGGVTMTPGDIFGGASGYANPAFIGSPIGTISGEPTVGQTLLYVIYDADEDIAQSGAGYAGDATAALTGKTVWINGVSYPFDGSDWSFNGTNTIAVWTPSGAPVLSNGVPCTLEVK